jgi:ArsR family transcriptional regulator
MTTATLAAVTKTFGHCSRLRILAMLRAGPLSVCQIAAVLAAPVSTVSGYLLELRQAGLVIERRKGRWIFYRLTEDRALATLAGAVLDAVDEDADVQRDAAMAETLRRESPSTVCDASSPANAVQVRA